MYDSRSRFSKYVSMMELIAYDPKYIDSAYGTTFVAEEVLI